MSRQHKHKPLSWMERTVFPALLLKQFKLYSQGKQPMAVIIYGLLDDEHYAGWQDTKKPPAPDYWRSGSNVAVFECISPFAKNEKVIEQFMASLPTNATNANPLSV